MAKSYTLNFNSEDPEIWDPIWTVDGGDGDTSQLLNSTPSLDSENDDEGLGKNIFFDKFNI